MHKRTPPYHPDLLADDDTRHFDNDIPNEVGVVSVPKTQLIDPSQPLAPPNGAAAAASKDPLLADKTHGAHLLEIRKESGLVTLDQLKLMWHSLAFKGWTFKAPQPESRYGQIARFSSGEDLEHLKDSSEETISPARFGTLKSIVDMGTVRSRALSL